MSNYNNNYLRIYFWRTISIILGFVSLFVVVPFLSSDKVLYGIFSVCTSLTVFFSYADLGFLSSATKYAAEFYVRKDLQSEIKAIGFAAFMMLMIFLLIDAVIIYLAYCPEVLIPGLGNCDKNYLIAQKLLLLLVIGCPFVIGQRVLQVIYLIRVEDYRYQIITIIGSLIRISSVFFFFTSSEYDIVGYYAFYQIINCVIVLYCLLDIRKYGYQIKNFLSFIRFDKKVFNDEKNLSFVSFLFMISMMAYNEFDQIAISNIYGVEVVSLYAIAFSIMTFMRTYSGLIYSPFTSRYNHFVGLKDFSGLVSFTRTVILTFAPVLIVPLLSFTLYANEFVESWVGSDYALSASLTGWMVMSYSVNFITTPISSFMTSLEKNKNIAVCAFFLPFIYWGGIVCLSPFMEYKSFAIMKFVAPSILAFYYWIVVNQEVKRIGADFIKINDLLISIVPSIIIAIILSLLISPLLRRSHGNVSLIINLCLMSVSVIITLLATLLFNRSLRSIVFKNIRVFILRK